MSLKTIAVPPNPSTRRGGRSAPAVAPGPKAAATGEIALAEADAQAARSAPRLIRQPPAHRYRIGERLRMGNGGYSIARAASFCKVVATLPYEGHGPLLYRVRSETEQFERVVAEADLSRNADGS